MKSSSAECIEKPIYRGETHAVAPTVTTFTAEYIQRFNDAERERQIRKTPGFKEALERSRRVSPETDGGGRAKEALRAAQTGEGNG